MHRSRLFAGPHVLMTRSLQVFPSLVRHDSGVGPMQPEVHNVFGLDFVDAGPPDERKIRANPMLYGDVDRDGGHNVETASANRMQAVRICFDAVRHTCISSDTLDRGVVTVLNRGRKLLKSAEHNSAVGGGTSRRTH